MGHSRSELGALDYASGGTLGIVGFLMKLINVTVGDTKGWFFLILGILNRIVQVLLAIYSICKWLSRVVICNLSPSDAIVIQILICRLLLCF